MPAIYTVRQTDGNKHTRRSIKDMDAIFSGSISERMQGFFDLRRAEESDVRNTLNMVDLQGYLLAGFDLRRVNHE